MRTTFTSKRSGILLMSWIAVALILPTTGCKSVMGSLRGIGGGMRAISKRDYEKEVKLAFNPAMETYPFLAMAAKRRGYNPEHGEAITFSIDEKTHVEFEEDDDNTLINLTIGIDSNSSKEMQEERVQQAVTLTQEIWDEALANTKSALAEGWVSEGKVELRLAKVLGFNGNVSNTLNHIANAARQEGYATELGMDDVTFTLDASTRVEYDVDMNNELTMSVLIDTSKISAVPEQGQADAALEAGRQVWKVAEAATYDHLEAVAAQQAKEEAQAKEQAAAQARADRIKRADRFLGDALAGTDEGERFCRREVAKDIEDSQDILRDKPTDRDLQKVADDVGDLLRDAKKDCPRQVADALERALGALEEG